MTRRSPVLRLALLLAAGLALAAPTAGAAEPLAEKAALAKAVAVLKGDPYGDTAAAVVAAIRERRLVPRRDTVCGGGASLAWAFRVVIPKPVNNPDSPIDGWLVLDAASGRTVCATLPFLD